jgi:hypothetical protein
MPTKEELELEVQRLTKQVAELESQVSARDALLQGSGEEGWLVTTPNPEYNGNTAGVQFVAGRAFIPKELPNAQSLVLLLATDFHYQASAMAAKDYKALEQPKKKVNEAQQMIEMLTTPGVM